MNIVYSMTHHVYEWILPSLRSLAETNPDAKVYILAEDDELPFELPMPARIVNVSGQKWFPQCGVNFNNDFKYINLLKVMYPSILSPLKKVIHLDIDTIICDRLDGMWETDLTGRWFGAVREKQKWYNPFGPVYYNMGVAVINLEWMRKDNIEPILAGYLNVVKTPFADQDAWNRYGIEMNKAVAIDNRWNESIPTGMTEHPAIIHYCGTKNWFTNQSMPRVEYLNKYRGSEK